MDEMKIISSFTTNVISRMVEVVLRKKMGHDVKFQLNKFETTVMDGKTHVHVDADIKLSKEELLKILKNVDLI